jgi:hypothetical protein
MHKKKVHAAQIPFGFASSLRPDQLRNGIKLQRFTETLKKDGSQIFLKVNIRQEPDFVDLDKAKPRTFS